MDLKYWSTVKPGVPILPVRKKMYGKYLYKACLKIRGGSVFKHENYWKSLSSLESYINWRKSFSHEYMWEHFVTVKDLLAINKVYKSLLADDEDRVCFRVEEPRVSFYFETETDIKKFLEEIPDSIRIYSIHGPKSESELQALKDNKIIYKNPMSDYAYCVTFKPGHYTELDIKTIFNLVNNLEAKTTPTFTRILKNNNNRRIFGSYKVFIKTQADFTWMQLSVRSELIGKINQLHFVNK